MDSFLEEKRRSRNVPQAHFAAPSRIQPRVVALSKRDRWRTSAVLQVCRQRGAGTGKDRTAPGLSAAHLAIDTPSPPGPLQPGRTITTLDLVDMYRKVVTVAKISTTTNTPASAERKKRGSITHPILNISILRRHFGLKLICRLGRNRGVPMGIGHARCFNCAAQNLYSCVAATWLSRSTILLPPGCAR